MDWEDKSRYCGAAEGTVTHSGLRCQHFDEERYRDDPELRQLQIDTLLKPMLLGMPVLNTAGEKFGLWPREEKDIHEGEFRGGLASKAKLGPAGRGLLQSLLSNEPGGVNTRQALAQCKLAKSDADPPLPACCNGAPPEIPNNFSDGAMKMPSTQIFGFGAFGTWHPGRKLEEVPLDPFEQQFGNRRCDVRGVGIHGALRGQCGSSTRGEIAAGIMGLYAPHPIHQATDSMAYCSKAN